VARALAVAADRRGLGAVFDSDRDPEEVGALAVLVQAGDVALDPRLPAGHRDAGPVLGGHGVAADLRAGRARADPDAGPVRDRRGPVGPQPDQVPLHGEPVDRPLGLDVGVGAGDDVAGAVIAAAD